MNFGRYEELAEEIKKGDLIDLLIFEAKKYAEQKETEVSRIICIALTTLLKLSDINSELKPLEKLIKDVEIDSNKIEDITHDVSKQSDQEPRLTLHLSVRSLKSTRNTMKMTRKWNSSRQPSRVRTSLTSSN